MSPLSPAAQAVYEAIKAAHFEIDPYGLSPADLRELAATTLRALAGSRSLHSGQIGHPFIEASAIERLADELYPPDGLPEVQP